MKSFSSEFVLEPNKNEKTSSDSLNPKILIKNIKENFLALFDEDTWSVYEICLSAVATLTLADVRDCLGIIIIGQSGNTKTTVLNLFRDITFNNSSGVLSKLTYWTDEFSPASFLTQATTVSKKNINDVDLIRKLPNQVLVVPDFAPLFGVKDDHMRKNFAILTRAMDGQGLARDGGVHGHREFCEECLFVLLGATVSIRKGADKVISQMGTRLLFYRMDEMASRSIRIDALTNQLLGTRQFNDEYDALKSMTEQFITQLIGKSGIREVNWVFRPNDDSVTLLVNIADLITTLRAEVVLNQESEEDEIVNQNEYAARVLNQLSNLARGRAICNDRYSLVEDDIRFVLKVALSSVPVNRAAVLKAAIDNFPNPFGIDELNERVALGKTTLRKNIQILEVLGILKHSTQGRADVWILAEPYEFLKYIRS